MGKCTLQENIGLIMFFVFLSQDTTRVWSPFGVVRNPFTNHIISWSVFPIMQTIRSIFCLELVARLVSLDCFYEGDTTVLHLSNPPSQLIDFWHVPRFSRDACPRTRVHTACLWSVWTRGQLEFKGGEKQNNTVGWKCRQIWYIYIF